jgi:hypothetical protein
MSKKKPPKKPNTPAPKPDRIVRSSDEQTPKPDPSPKDSSKIQKK